MADGSTSRTLPATPRKLERARADGQVPRSRDLGHFAALGLGVALLGACAPELTRWLAHTLADGLRFGAADVRTPELLTERLAMLGAAAMVALLPIGAVSVVLALAAGLVSGGWNFTFKPLTPRFGKLDPWGGLLRMFSGDHLRDTLKASLLALVLFGTGSMVLWQERQRCTELLAMPLPAALAASGEVLRRGLVALGIVLALFALVDVPLQRQALARRLRMSVEELKREMRESEGNTEVKGKLRVRMREIVNRRMLSAVPKADLVVMNPTHYAVALRYDEARMGAPRVVAKGADFLALKIRDIAREARVPVLEAPPLARALYAHTDVDREIPQRLLTAVAQVLAWVYQLRDAVASGRPFSAEAPRPDVPADMDPLTGTDGPAGRAADA